MPLTDVAIRNTKPGEMPKRMRDGHGLYLEVWPSGSRLWRYRFRVAGKESKIALGEYFPDKRPGHVSIEDARRLRAEARELVKQGRNPAHVRRQERDERIAADANTFESCSREWLAIRAREWTPRRVKQVTRWLERDAFPVIGSTPIRNVTADAIIRIMEGTERGGNGVKPAPTVALLLRQFCDAIFRYAKKRGKVADNPAADLDDVVAKPPTKKWSPLPRARIGEMLHAIDGYVGDPATAIALRLLLLTIVRSGELRAAQWVEFDLEHATWTIPAERMKARETHVVPLSEQALALLRRLQAITGARAYLFPNHKRPTSYIGATTLNAALVRMGFEGELSPHGMRKIASTMLNEMGFPGDVIEKQLAHGARDKIRATYNFAQHLPERRAMMQQWADMVDALATGAAKVIPLQRRA